MGILLGGLPAGLVHVLSGPDHLAAVAPYAAQQRRQAWRVGLRWGLGHTGGVLLIGVLLLLLRGALPVRWLSAGSERLVGAVLIAIGLWGLRTAARVRADVFEQPPVASPVASPAGHSHSPPYPHSHAAFGVGLLHGLAGSSHLLGILPALALPSTLAAGTWLLLFGAGTVLGMMAFATVIGLAATRFLSSAGVRGYRALLYACAVAAVGVGVFWLATGGA